MGACRQHQDVERTPLPVYNLTEFKKTNSKAIIIITHLQKHCQDYSFMPSKLTSYNIASGINLYLTISFGLNHIFISFSASSALAEA